MTTLSPASSKKPIAAPSSASSLIARIGTANVVLIGLLAAAFASVYFRWIWRQLGPEGFSWTKSEDWGHAYIVPLISIYYVWKHRAEFDRHRPQPFAPGLSVMLLGVATYIYFTTGYSNHMFQGFALILALAGLLLFVLGPKLFPMFVFPLAYLCFAVTISEQVMNQLTWGLKLLASQGSYVLLILAGIDTELQGNILNVHHDGKVTPLNVADACAGMRMVVAFIALAVAVAFLSCRQWWQRIAVMLLAVPVALLMNIVRVAVLAAATLVDEDLSVGGAHTLIGTLLLIPAFILFMTCVWALKKMSPDGPGPASAKAAKKGSAK
jgi:exosortase